MHYNFEWDNQKAITNLHKHAVSFERAAAVFLDPNMLVMYDDEHSTDEERWITVGIDSRGILLTVCHTFKEESEMTAIIRIFSARKAVAKETTQYEEL
ncbi:MAG: BrnT family toxin [Desulfuromonadales bacterium]